MGDFNKHIELAKEVMDNLKIITEFFEKRFGVEINEKAAE